jgi:hypothetical protein
MSLKNVKAAIKDNLDELVVAGVIIGATETDIKTDPLSANVRYPHAFVMPPAIESNVLDNRTVTRTYSFAILVLFRAEDLDTTAELEERIEAMLNKFDNDPTLSGTALGGMLPVSSAPEPFQHNGNHLIAVELNIQATEIVDLTFS